MKEWISEKIGDILYKSNGTAAGADEVARFMNKRMKEYATSYVEKAAFKANSITAMDILKLKEQIKEDRL